MWLMKPARAPFAALIAGLLLLAASTCNATTCVAEPVKPIRHVCGIVKNEAGAPIPHAKVTVLKGGTELGAVQTGTDGKFSLERLEAGNYDVQVEADGYHTERSSIVIVRPATKCKRGLYVLLGFWGLSIPRHS